MNETFQLLLMSLIVLVSVVYLFRKTIAPLIIGKDKKEKCGPDCKCGSHEVIE